MAQHYSANTKTWQNLLELKRFNNYEALSEAHLGTGTINQQLRIDIVGDSNLYFT